MAPGPRVCLVGRRIVCQRQEDCMRFWHLLLLLPSVALAKSETWPRVYNDGVTAYHSNDFARAAALFESATASPDRTLQQRALYNLGNTNRELRQGTQRGKGLVQSSPLAAKEYRKLAPGWRRGRNDRPPNPVPQLPLWRFPAEIQIR